MELIKLPTKEQFIKAYEKYPPKKWIKFAFKYFSKETEAKNMKLSNSIAWILGFLFLGGFFATAFDLPKHIIGPITFTFVGLLSVLVVFLFAAIWANNKRIKNIANELNVSPEEYNKLVGWWGNELK